MAFNNGQKGWLKLENKAETRYYELFVLMFYAEPTFKQEFTHTPNRGHFTLPLEIFWFDFTAIDVYLTLTTDIQNLMADLISWQNDGYYWLSFYKDTSKTAWKFDNVHSRYKVSAKNNGIRQLEKVSNGNEETYKFGQMQWEESQTNV